MNRRMRLFGALSGLTPKAAGLGVLLITMPLLFGTILWGRETASETVMLTSIRAARYSGYSRVTFRFGDRFQFEKPVRQGNEIRLRLKNVRTTLPHYRTLPAYRKFKNSNTWVWLEKAGGDLVLKVGFLNNADKIRYVVLTDPDRLYIKFYRETADGSALPEQAAAESEDSGEKAPLVIEENPPAEAAPAKAHPGKAPAAAEGNPVDKAPAVIAPAKASPAEALPPAEAPPPEKAAEALRPAASESAGQNSKTVVQSAQGNLLTLNFFQTDIREILSGLAMQQEKNIVTAKDVSGKVSVYLFQVDFDQALTSICQAGGFSFQKQGKVYFVFKPKKEAETKVSNLEMRIFKLQYADMNKIEEVLGAIPDIRMIKLHEPSRTIVVEDTPENIAKVETLVRFWDTPPKQVLIEAKILEISLTDDMSLGVDWEKVLGDVRIGTGDFSRAVLPTTAGVSPVPAEGAGLFANIITGAGTTEQFAAAVDLLQEKTQIRTLSSPKILAIHGKPAKVIVGGQQGYTVTTVNQGVSTESIEFIDTGTILDITPYIDHDNNVLLMVKPELTSAQIEEGVPVTSSTMVTTWMMAKSGETVFIGGLIQDIDTKTYSGVPCLGDVPLMRYIFGRTGKGTDKSELIVLITPQILEVGGHRSQEVIEKTKKIEKILDEQGKEIEKYFEKKY